MPWAFGRPSRNLNLRGGMAPEYNADRALGRWALPHSGIVVVATKAIRVCNGGAGRSSPFRGGRFLPLPVWRHPVQTSACALELIGVAGVGFRACGPFGNLPKSKLDRLSGPTVRSRPRRAAPTSVDRCKVGHDGQQVPGALYPGRRLLRFKLWDDNA